MAMQRILLFLVFILLGYFPASAQTPNYSVSNAHAHNDYRQQQPFYDAYHAGFGSIEVDIYLEHGKLLVAHDRADLDTAPPLRTLYLEPLANVLSINNGFPYKDSAKQLILLIDIKSEAAPTLHALEKTLAAYPSIRGSGKVKLVITGNRPPSSAYSSYPSFIYFDGRPVETYNSESLKKIALISDDLKKYTAWSGNTTMSAADQQKLRSLINNIHASGKPVRFWNAPDFENAWAQLMRLGVDYLNTDNIAAMSDFLNKQK